MKVMGLGAFHIPKAGDRVAVQTHWIDAHHQSGTFQGPAMLYFQWRW